MPPGLVQNKQCVTYHKSQTNSGAPSEDGIPHSLENQSALPLSQMPLRVGKVEKPLPVGLVPPGLLQARNHDDRNACGPEEPTEELLTPRRKRKGTSAVATQSTACPADEEEEEPIQYLDDVCDEGIKEAGKYWPQRDDASDPLVDCLWEMKEKNKVSAWRLIYQCKEQHAASLDWLNTVQENLRYLSMTSTRGSLIVQDAISIVDVAQQKAMARQLHGHVLEAMRSPHANFVLQKCITEMPLSNIQFIVDTMPGNVMAIAHHYYGCRVIMRLFEHCSFEQTDNLAKELLSDTEALIKLCKKRSGNYVVQSVLEHLSVTSDQRRRLVDLLCSHFCELSVNMIGKFVVLKLVALGVPLDKCNLEQFHTRKTLNQQKSLKYSNHGSYVAKSMRRWRQR